MAVLFSNFGSSRAFLQTLGDFLSLGANTVREIQEAIGLAGAEVRSTLNTLDGTIRDLMDEIEDKYQDNLNITIDSLDSATRNKLLEIESLMLSVNEVLKDDVRFLTDEARALLDDATLQIRQLSSDVKEDLQDVIFVAGETGAFLIDKTTETLITVGALVFLAFGVIVFVWLLFRSSSGLKGFAAALAYTLVIGYIGVFGALLLVPQFRAFVISSTGFGLKDRLESVTEQPDIFSIRPTEIIVGETTEIDIWGNSLMPNGEQPVVTIGDVALPITASDDRLVVDVSSLQENAQSSSVAVGMDFEIASDVVAVLTNPGLTRDLLESTTGPTLALDTRIGTVIDTNFDFSLVPTSVLVPTSIALTPVPTPISTPTGPITDRFPSRVIMDRAILNDIGFSPDFGIDVGDLVEVPNVNEIISLIPEGAAVMVMDYENFEDITAIVRVTIPQPPQTPPDLRVSSFTLNPSTSIKDDNVQAVITIQNAGQTEATNFNVVWRPTGAVNMTRSQNVTSLAGGATQTFTFNFAYPTVGTFTSVVELDTLNQVAESNEGNNSQQRNMTVQERPPRRAEVTVTFTSVTIIDDSETGEGELVLDFNVNGQTARYPNSGTKGINSGNSYSFTRTLSVTLQEGQNLNIFVNGREEDSGINGGDDDMGRVDVSFTSGQDWGSGSRSTQAQCSDGCYRIFYTISVRNLP
ncbi:hypothetical protein G4Y79_12555 [Phototrophicus methaneseepsis]|uniref:CARDB domain-containing protein n=1 Tax=Phototrophicus methaneseepsis TaxID=2710758 RepID=A0A7S8E552_9CHLR|nr:CARDB domain-containing protein [Phototrophicus methaneseepsis]QPC80544.1 hypothetical protein G4Y79_12555 [Phototrophicus methaneseepsis]